MNQVCRVMVVEMPGRLHPCAYLLDPAYDLVFLGINDHPHPRMDQTILYDGRMLAGLCIYSAAEFEYTGGDRHTQFMDQVLLWIGRHLIWLRTRRLYRRSTGAELYVPRPGESIGRMVFPDECWRGTWVGPRARSTTRAEHVAHIPPAEECWCGSGSPYSDCHRPIELEELQRTAV